MKKQLKEAWLNTLQYGLPGPEAQARMAPDDRGAFTDTYSSARNAAVMALLYPGEQGLSLAFIKRNEYPGVHSGQVSFPGGMYEESDKDLQETALRETQEELGIIQDIAVLGALSPLHIPVSNFLVHPYLGWMDESPVFRPDPIEVQYIIETGLNQLMDPANHLQMQIKHQQRVINAPYYRVGKEKVWGATAMILSEFLQLAASMP